MLLSRLTHEKMVVLSCGLNFPFPLDGSLWENPAAMLQGCPVQSLIGGNLEMHLSRTADSHRSERKCKSPTTHTRSRVLGDCRPS